MVSAKLHPEVVDKYIQDEQAKGRMLGPFPLSMGSVVHVNRFRVIPKGTTGKFRLITDLFLPHGQSVNEGIEPDLCSLSYSSVDDVAEIVARLGWAKMDNRVRLSLDPGPPPGPPPASSRVGWEDMHRPYAAIWPLSAKDL